MCGIVGITNGTHVQPDLLTMLKRLEYRGYDSSGIAVVDASLHIARSAGNISALQRLLDGKILPGHAGIGHTRWATHGAPTDNNAHPHSYHHVATVHNGIIENHQQLKQELIGLGHVFSSETDSEIIPHLVIHYRSKGYNPQEALYLASTRLEGSYAIAMVVEDMSDTVFATANNSPLVIGKSKVGAYLSSDQTAIADYADDVYYLEEGEIAVLKAGQAELYQQDMTAYLPAWKVNDSDTADVDIGHYNTFTQKEIAQQPGVIRNMILHTIASDAVSTASHIHVIACGSSYYAAALAKYWMEQYIGVQVTMHIASEFRYYPPPLEYDAIAICVSQSGETADTLAAMEYIKTCDIPVIALTNSRYSQMARSADYVWHIEAGKEIGVAATKSFTAQTCLLMNVAMSYAPNDNSKSEWSRLPSYIEHVLQMEEKLSIYADAMCNATSLLFLGRGPGWAAAQEAALKVKELSYIQAEAYAAGELKHGPIALIEKDLPVWICAPYQSPQYGKIIANAEEVLARGAKVVIVSNESAPASLKNAKWIHLPDASESLTALLFVVVSQLFATHLAEAKGIDVDKPRNLAKSVTVE